MNKTFLFSIAVAFCFEIRFNSAKGVSDVDVSISETETTNYTPVDAAVNKEFYFNGSELEVDRVDECRCKNGKCMPVCDIEKTTPCKDPSMVCVCNPEFGKISDDECKYCDCGLGFNCTFRKRYDGTWEKKCICPDDYLFDERISSKCKPMCSDDRPCQNGGTCTWGGKWGWLLKTCHCPFLAMGDFCEEVDCGLRCQNRLEVDCLLNEIGNHVAYCSCKNSSLYYDQEAGICKPCQCENGYCAYEFDYFDRKLVCRCPWGYKNFNGYCKECDCGDGADAECDLDSNGQKICKCRDGFYGREGRCLACGCKGDMITRCELIGNVKRCFCREGFEDVLGHCEDANECETNNTCPHSTTCYNTFGSFYCECPKGYRGTDERKVEPGEVCEDINECTETSFPCGYWKDLQLDCVNLPGSYKCECRRGYEPRWLFKEPQSTECVKTSKNGGPTAIVVCTTLILMAVSYFVHIRVKKRASRLN